MSGKSPDDKFTPGQPIQALVTPAATELNRHKAPDETEISPAEKIIELHIQNEVLANEKAELLARLASIDQAVFTARVEREFQEKQAHFSPSKLGQTPYANNLPNPFEIESPPLRHGKHVELEMTTEDAATIKGLLKSIPLFDYQAALTDPVVVMAFVTALEDYFCERNWTSPKNEQLMISTLIQKLSKNSETVLWRNSLKASGQVPTTLQGWLDQITNDTSQRNLRDEAAMALKKLQMKQDDMDLMTHVMEFTRLANLANRRQDHQLAIELENSLNPFWYKYILNQKAYADLGMDYRPQSLLAVITAAKLLYDRIKVHSTMSRPATKQDKPISKSDKTAKKPVIPATATTYAADVAPVSPRAAQRNEEFAHRLKMGLCHYCKQPGHIKSNCPAAAAETKRQQSRPRPVTVATAAVAPTNAEAQSDERYNLEATAANGFSLVSPKKLLKRRPVSAVVSNKIVSKNRFTPLKQTMLGDEAGSGKTPVEPSHISPDESESESKSSEMLPNQPGHSVAALGAASKTFNSAEG